MVVHCCLKSFALKLSAECRIFLPELANIARAWLKFSLLQRTLGSFANGGEKGIYIAGVFFHMDPQKSDAYLRG